MARLGRRRDEGRHLWVDDKYSVESWAEALPGAVNVSKGDPAVYVGFGLRVPTVRDRDVLKLASLLPLDCERHLLLCKGRDRASLEFVVPVGKTVAWMQNQLAQAVQIQKGLAKERAERAKTMHSLIPSEDVIKRGLDDGDKTALAACRSAFEQLTAACEQDVNGNKLSGRERTELGFTDAGNLMSVSERGAIVAACERRRCTPPMQRPWERASRDCRGHLQPLRGRAGAGAR
ncbi:hypothetical protein LuPra_03950 [Luteitalea pratensis]|uniref:Uncharacterized protein n=1 Tax=Luteitalea pratensis TaxID=1855912 RepID=A0A143PQK4_LUTPR|nr:hypothetical protein [Luteitalea pratensis]AMY10711.1 hypothetical protein LuPra_03950 [Luteitalea pratensis]